MYLTATTGKFFWLGIFAVPALAGGLLFWRHHTESWPFQKRSRFPHFEKAHDMVSTINKQVHTKVQDTADAVEKMAGKAYDNVEAGGQDIKHNAEAKVRAAGTKVEEGIDGARTRAADVLEAVGGHLRP